MISIDLRGAATGAVLALGLAALLQGLSGMGNGGGEGREPAATAPRPVTASQAAPLAPRQAAAPRRADVPQTPPASHQSAADLHAFALAALDSPRTAVVEEGSLALYRCEALLGDAAALRQSGDAARQLASAQLLRRCEGFEHAGAAARERLRELFAARLRADGSHQAEGPQAAPSLLPGWQLGRLLQAPDAARYEQARPALTAAMARQRGIEEESQAFSDLQAAVLLASCDFGRDCSAGAFDALRRCAYQGVCGLGLFDSWRDGLSPSSIAAIEALRADIVAALRAGQPGRLGYAEG